MMKVIEEKDGYTLFTIKNKHFDGKYFYATTGKSGEFGSFYAVDGAPATVEEALKLPARKVENDVEFYYISLTWCGFDYLEGGEENV